MALQLPRPRTDQSVEFVDKMEKLLADVRGRKTAFGQDPRGGEDVVDVSDVQSKDMLRQAWCFQLSFSLVRFGWNSSCGLGWHGG